MFNTRHHWAYMLLQKISGISYSVYIYKTYMLRILHVRSKPPMNLLIFATNHNLMKDINKTVSCPCNTLRTSNSFARSDTGVVTDSESHLIRMCKPSLLSASLAVRVHIGCPCSNWLSAFTSADYIFTKLFFLNNQ